MAKELHILFTGVGRRVELIQAFREAALCQSVTLKIYGADMTDSAPALAFCDYYRSVCGMHDENYIPELLEICKNDAIDLIIPTIDTDLLVLSENTTLFSEIGTRVMISSPEMIRICRDKNLTSSFFESCGLHAPTPIDNYKKYSLGFPAFIKPKDGSSSINAYKVEDAEQLALYASQIEDYIVQPFISGREYTIDIFCDFVGNPASIVPRERLQVRAGEVLKTCITMDEQMIEEAKAICTAFKPCGPITVQLIRDTDNVDWFIEINPRFGGGAPLSMKAGARSAEYILQLMSGNKLSYCKDIADGAIYSRFDQSVCVKEGKSEIKGIIFDLDDTLYSEKEYIRSGFKAVSDYLGSDYTDRLWSFFEDGKLAIDELLKEIDKVHIKAEILEVYRSHYPDIHLYDGVKEMLVELRQRGYKLGIITDGRPEGQRNKIAALGLEPLVDDIIITDELGGNQFRKPCDIGFRILKTKWRIDSSKLVYVGDNPIKDFQAPIKLGISSIFFNNQNGLYYGFTNADINTIKSIIDLYEVILYE